MRFLAVEKKVEEGVLTDLDKVVLGECKKGPNIVQIIKACRLSRGGDGRRKGYLSEQIVKSVRKLVRLGLLKEGR